MEKLNWGKRVYVLFLLCATTAISLRAQTFTTLGSFDYADGELPEAAPVQATDGNLYGTTFYGGANGVGTVFKITPSGTLTTLYSFCAQSGCTDGANPEAGLVQASDGNLYGTAFYGSGAGVVFKITLGGTLTTLYTFCSMSGCTDGANPEGALVQAADGDLYGTTYYGGANGDGTVFKIALSGALTTLHSFDASDGANPGAGLVQAADGSLYGTTLAGGANDSCNLFVGYVGCGTVFKITPSGALTTLYSFCSQSGCVDGEYPEAGLVQAADGNLYGTTAYGGANGAGTVLKITPSGVLTTLHSFDGTDGDHPDGTPVQATDGNFYATTYLGGANGDGTVFKITPSGLLTALYSFCAQSGCGDGAHSFAAPIQDTNGNFYGTTASGGANGDGTVFSLSVGLGPFVETVPTSGAVGTAVMILGNNLTGATSVTFNGIATAFTVVSSSEITTTVPAGATTGIVQVKTPSDTLNSNMPFQVGTLENTPQAQIVNLENTVKALVSDGTINSALGRGLLAPLNAALRALDAGHATEAIRHLDGFIIEVRRLVILGRLTPAEGNALIDAANSIITALGG
jgi:uncharacterized repeat protein (TIGR03803 family)